MSNLYEILQSAQGGQAIENLAKQFDISTEEAEAAARELVPALSAALLDKTSDPDKLDGVVGLLGETQHFAAFADPAAAQSEQTTQKGDEIVARLFGSSQLDELVIGRAAAATGLRPELLMQMLPVISSILLGGVKSSMQGQGLGGVFSQLIEAAQRGGLGSILGQTSNAGSAAPQPQAEPGPAPSPSAGGGLGSILGQLLRAGLSPSGQQRPQPGVDPSAAPAGGLGGILGTVLGSLLGRAGGAAPAGPGTAFPGSAPGLDPSAIQASLEALTKILQPGAPPASRALGGAEMERAAPSEAEEPDVRPDAEPAQKSGVSPDLQNEIGAILDRKEH